MPGCNAQLRCLAAMRGCHAWLPARPCLPALLADLLCYASRAAAGFTRHRYDGSV